MGKREDAYTDDWVVVKTPAPLKYCASFVTKNHILLVLQIILLLAHVDWRYIALLRWLSAYNKYKKYTFVLGHVGRFGAWLISKRRV
jgi:purine nucleoside permease